MAKQLWSSVTADAWIDLKQQRANSWQQAPEKLQQLNSWYEAELPASINSRSPARHITQPELVQLVDWKLNYGKWRPRLLDFAKAAKDQEVQDASSKAFAMLPGNSASSAGTTITSQAAAAAQLAAPPSLDKVKAALEALTVLKGVGPATASALVAVADASSSCPFMSDEALEAALGARSYTVKEYLQLVEALRAKSDWLNQQDPGGSWTAVMVERCLYAAELSAKPAKPVKPATRKPAQPKTAAGSTAAAPKASAAKAGGLDKALAGDTDASFAAVGETVEAGETGATAGKRPRRSAAGVTKALDGDQVYGSGIVKKRKGK